MLTITPCENLKDISKEKIERLNSNLRYIPPERYFNCLFNGNMSHWEGICKILEDNEYDNKNALKIFNEITELSKKHKNF